MDYFDILIKFKRIIETNDNISNLWSRRREWLLTIVIKIIEYEDGEIIKGFNFHEEREIMKLDNLKKIAQHDLPREVVEDLNLYFSLLPEGNENTCHEFIISKIYQ